MSSVVWTHGRIPWLPNRMEESRRIDAIEWLRGKVILDGQIAYPGVPSGYRATGSG